MKSTRKKLIIIGIVVVLIVIIAAGVLLYKKRQYLEQETTKLSYNDCVIDNDCVLAQDGWCKTVLAINKTKKVLWQEDDIKQIEIARQSAQTCEPVPEGYLDINNFKATCKQLKCVAEFIGITQESAIYRIRQRTEVFKYELDLSKAGKKASFNAQDEGDYWLVQVFEVVQNENSSSHTATFGWYKVNKKTGQVDAEI